MTPAPDVVTPDRRQRRWHEVHDRLYDAACDLFLANGYRATSVDEIAERADVARKTAFNHYPRKRDFIGEWGSRRRDRVLAVIESELPEGAAFEPFLRRYFAELAVINRSERALTICMFEGWRDSGGPFDAEPHDLQDVLRGFVAGAVARGEIPASVDAARLGTVLYSSYFGLLHDWCTGTVRRAPFDLAAAFEQLLDIVLRGVRGV